MSEFQLRDFFKELFSMKKIVCISVILSVVVCAGIGYYRFKRSQIGVQKEKIETYEKSMKNFDEAIKDIEDNITLTQAQIDKQQKFLDKYLFMKMDSDNLQIAEINYLIETELNGAERIRGLSGIYLRSLEYEIEKEVKKVFPEYESSYFDNVVGIITHGNTFTVRVHHYDMKEAQKFLSIAERLIESLKKDVTIPHTMSKINEKQYVKASNWLKKLQIEAQNELKWNRNTLADFKRKYADFQNSRTYYERMNKPVTLVSVSPVKTLIKYSVFGVFLGLLWPILWLFYKEMMHI